MSGALDGRDAARPPDHDDPAAALPLGSREGLAPVAVTAEHEAVVLAGDDLHAVVRRLAFPAVASNLLMTLFASVDTYWVGTAVGATGLAAVSTSIFWVWMLVAIAEMIGVGLTAVAARRHGERRPGEAARVVGDSVLLAVALGVAVAAAGLLALDWLFAVMRTPPEVSALGRAYLGTYLLGAPLLYGFFAVDAGFRAAGDTRTPLALLSGSIAVTLVLDPVLILGLGPAPELGIAGAAVATVGTRALAFVAGVLLLRRRGLVAFARPRPAPLLAVCRVGLPTALTGGFFSVIYVLLTRTTTQFGTPALAALGLGHRVESWLYMLAVGFGTATAAVVGQNLGAGQVERARRAAWVGVGYAIVPAGAMALLMLLIPAQLAGLFTDDPAVVAETARYLRIAAVAQVALVLEVVLEGALGGAGDTVPPMLASTTLTAARLPLAAVAAAVWGVSGIWWTISLTAAARGVAMALIWRSGRWTRRSL